MSNTTICGVNTLDGEDSGVRCDRPMCQRCMHAPALPPVAPPLPERLWQMTRIGTGDYTLLSNDQSVLWRIFSYDEIGTVTDPDGRPVVGKRWILSRFKHAPDRVIPADIESHWGSAWEVVAEMLRRRQDAVDEAMRREP